MQSLAGHVDGDDDELAGLVGDRPRIGRGENEGGGVMCFLDAGYAQQRRCRAG